MSAQPKSQSLKVFTRKNPFMALRFPGGRIRLCLFALLVGWSCQGGIAAEPSGNISLAEGQEGVSTAPTGAGVLLATEFLPPGFVRDGSQSYQPLLQRAIDAAAKQHCLLVFPPMVYLIDDPDGLRLADNSHLVMEGAVFRTSQGLDRDGQVFFGKDVQNVTLLGGRIEGARDHWPDSVNIAGVRIVGRSSHIRIRDMMLLDLSSCGVGLFAEGPEAMIEDVWIENLLIRRCCNKYIDYLEPNPGPVPGSRREDQGLVAFYFVRNFVVSGCSLEDSRSDGTHFYRCVDGRFVNNRVIGAKMGGYFLETCRSVLASGNVIRGNGSRGVTIERGSCDCILQGNLIEESGREGLWAPESIRVIVTGNIFRCNGRKDHAELDGEIMINKSRDDPSKTPRAENYRISDNVFITTSGQDAVIRVLPPVCDIIIENNTLRGDCRTVRVAGDQPGVEHVVLRNNDGIVIEGTGSGVEPADSSRP